MLTVLRSYLYWSILMCKPFLEYCIIITQFEFIYLKFKYIVYVKNHNVFCTKRDLYKPVCKTAAWIGLFENHAWLTMSIIILKVFIGIFFNAV